jgi:hypothetical protein
MTNPQTRKVFYVDVGNMSPEDATTHLEQIKKEFLDRQVEAFRNESGQEFTDISSEASRVYNFGQKGFVKINNPVYLSVSPSGGHRLFTSDGQSHYVPAGWIQLSWTARPGEPNFVK